MVPLQPFITKYHFWNAAFRRDSQFGHGAETAAAVFDSSVAAKRFNVKLFYNAPLFRGARLFLEVKVWHS